MLLPYTTLEYYGPAAAALVGGASPSVAVFSAKKSVRAGETIVGTGSAVLLRPYRGRQVQLIGYGVGTLTVAAQRGIRAALVVAVNKLTQDDVTSAVMGSIIEGGYSLKETMRLLLAFVAGNATTLDTNPSFKSIDGTKTRLAGTIVDGTRTITTRDVA